MRRLLAFVALVLTVTFLTAAPAFGAAKGTDRPFKGSASGTGTVETALVGGSLVFVGGTEGGTINASHLGSGTFQAVTEFTSLTTGTTTTTFVAANGDTVTMSGTNTFAQVNPTTFTFTLVSKITSGSGRFAGASGTDTAIGTSTLDSPTSLAFHISFTFLGTITY